MWGCSFVRYCTGQLSDDTYVRERPDRVKKHLSVVPPIEKFFIYINRNYSRSIAVCSDDFEEKTTFRLIVVLKK